VAAAAQPCVLLLLLPYSAADGPALLLLSPSAATPEAIQAPPHAHCIFAALQTPAGWRKLLLQQQLPQEHCSPAASCRLQVLPCCLLLLQRLRRPLLPPWP
jgi:hypothetical protein